VANPDRIDVHHHVVPPFWREDLDAHGGDPSGWKHPVWSVDADRALMDRLGIRLAMLSLTAPGIVGWQGKAQAEIARRVNEFTAGVVAQHPERYGNFITPPMNDIEAAMTEIAFGLDHLQADGVVLLSNYGGTYLGDARFAPVWDELDRREAVVLIHPTMPPMPLMPGIPGPMLDYPFDTTRAAVSLLASGTLGRCRRVKIILSHAGGFLPYGAFRFSGSLANLEPGQRTSDDFIAEMQRFWFDTALSSSASALPSLMQFAAPGHVLFGSDTPYARDARVIGFTESLDAWDGFADGQRDAINRGSALALFPRLRR